MSRTGQDQAHHQGKEHLDGQNKQHLCPEVRCQAVDALPNFSLHQLALLLPRGDDCERRRERNGQRRRKRRLNGQTRQCLCQTAHSTYMPPTKSAKTRYWPASSCSHKHGWVTPPRVQLLPAKHIHLFERVGPDCTECTVALKACCGGLKLQGDLAAPNAKHEHMHATCAWQLPPQLAARGIMTLQLVRTAGSGRSKLWC